MAKVKGKANKNRKDAHKKLLSDTYDAAEKYRAYNPGQIKGLRPNKYKDNLPDRPKAPKLPNLKTPGGNLQISKVLKPSGLPGTNKDYKSKPNYSNVYKNVLPPKGKKGKNK